MQEEENETKKPEIKEGEEEQTEEELKEETGLMEPAETEEPEEKEKEAAEEPVEAKKEEAVPVDEEVKPSKEGKPEEEEEEIVEEHIYTVPLGKVRIVPANKRAPRAMRMLRSFITKHMKLEAPKKTEEEEEEEPAKLTISNEVNLKVWSRGIGKPPRKIRVRAAKNKEGNVTVYLAEGD